MFKFGLVGCGRISKNHFKAFSDNSNRCKLTAVCDVVQERVEKAAKENGATPYLDIDEMLKKEELDAVVVSTPSGMHPAHGIKVAKSGRHVISEKPMGITLEAVDNLIHTCDEAKVHLFVVKQNRLNPTMQALKKAVDKGRFGRIFFAQSNIFWSRPQEYYDSARWRGTWEFDGGAFLNQASHYVDSLYWLIGDVENVSAITATLARKIETEDTGAAILRFRNGAIGTINVTMLAYPKNFEGSITLLGEKGTVRISGIAINSIEKWEFSDYDDDDKEIMANNYNPPNVYGFGHSAYLHNVLDVLERKAEPETDGRSGRKSLELIHAIYRSSREGKQISLPLKI
ncbi:MAG: Gfo/Idh/MocA family oxidoreductase [Candidatus Riflebacteria bacterium]|nr:Gfo/Idh/MocA family oxidoreductase [Candidatus Riflebacteria bacterium]